MLGIYTEEWRVEKASLIILCIIVLIMLCGEHDHFTLHLADHER